MKPSPKHFDIIRRPVITEKATLASQNGGYVFEVAMSATKPQIREAVESIFNVNVRSVKTLIVKGKNKRFRGFKGRRRDIKKAYIMLKDGNIIDIHSGL